MRPTLSIKTARELLRYDREVFDRFERSISRRSWKEVTADRGIGHLSLKNTLVHILNVHEAWCVAVAEKRWEIFDEPGRRGPEIRSWAEFRKYRDRVWAAVDGFSGGLNERKLGHRVQAPWMPGNYTLGDAIVQVTIEQAHHLGEIIGAYWQEDRRPPPMTWIENVRSGRRGRRR